jgi:hypothetical protein
MSQDPLNAADAAAVMPDRSDLTPTVNRVDFFQDELSPAAPPATPASQRTAHPNEPGEIESPEFGAPLSKEENAYLREIIRRNMEQEAEMHAAQDFLNEHRDYKATPQNWQTLQDIIANSGGDIHDPEQWHVAFGVAKTEGLLELNTVPVVTGDPELDAAANTDTRRQRVAMREQFQRERQTQIERATQPTVRTGIPNTGVEAPPPEEEDAALFAARIQSLPIDQARQEMLKVMQRTRQARGEFVSSNGRYRPF